ncbi:hypothetical protein [Buchananella felis]|uniref:ORC-CDC6 family AAA ATPase n=1 Tax=Buchananella felis TaxID=3231492 RepID=UPI0035288E09
MENESQTRLVAPSTHEPLAHPAINGAEVETKSILAVAKGAQIITGMDSQVGEHSMWLLLSEEYAPETLRFDQDSLIQAYINSAKQITSLSPTVSPVALQTITAQDLTPLPFVCYKLDPNFVPISEVILRADNNLRPKHLASMLSSFLRIIDASSARMLDPECLNSSNIFISKTFADAHGYNCPSKLGVIKFIDRRDSDSSLLVRSVLQAFEPVINHIRRLRTTVLTDHECSILTRIESLVNALLQIGPSMRYPSISEIRRRLERTTHYDREDRLPFASSSDIRDNTNAITLNPQDQCRYFQDTNPSTRLETLSRIPQFIYGKRGCGKTTLIQTLTWQYEAGLVYVNQSELSSTAHQNHDRLGLFASVVRLTRNTDPTANELLHLVFLQYVTQLVQAADYYTELETEADADFCVDITPIVRSLTESYGENVGFAQCVTSESLQNVLQYLIARINARTFIVEHLPQPSFERLVALGRQIYKPWRNTYFFFLLDDISTRNTRFDTIRDAVSYLLTGSPNYAFKFCAEANIGLRELFASLPVNQGRDYTVIDLDSAFTNNRQFSKHLCQIINTRYGYPQGYGIERRLGDVRYTRIAECIARDASLDTAPSTRSPCYYGTSTLAAVANGNVGDALYIYQEMLRQAKNSISIEPKIQHQSFMNVSQRALNEFTRQEQTLLLSHIRAFSIASHLELVSSYRNSPNKRGTLRSHLRVDIPMESYLENQAKGADTLITKHVFDLGQPVERTKDVTQPQKLMISLEFRPLLGLSYRIPLAKRHRFELKHSEVAEWLARPTYAQLTKVKKTVSNVSEDLPSSRYRILDPHATSVESAWAEDTNDSHYTPSITLRDVDDPADTITQLDLTSSVLVTGDGFEDRSPAFVNFVRKHGSSKFKRIHVIAYKVPGKGFGEIDAVGASICRHPDSPRVQPRTAHEIVSSLSSETLYIDVSALSKPWIYSLMREACSSRKSIYIVHTSAQFYHPTDQDLAPLAKLIEQGDRQALVTLNRLTEGEGKEFKVVQLQHSGETPGLGNVILPISLNYARLDSILSLQFTGYHFILPVHDGENWSQKNRILNFIAQQVFTQQNDRVLTATAFKFEEAYKTLQMLDSELGNDPLDGIHFALTGTKMHTLAMGAFAADHRVAAVWYPRPTKRKIDRFTSGVGQIRLFRVSYNDILSSYRDSELF